MTTDARNHERARKLASRAGENTPEGRIAKRQLEKLITEHPELDYLSIKNPMGLVTLEMDVPSLAHSRVLDTIAEHTGCQHLLRAEPSSRDRLPIGRHELQGCRADVTRAADLYLEHEIRLDVLVREIGRTYANGLQLGPRRPSLVSETTDETPEETTETQNTFTDPYLEWLFEHDLRAELFGVEGSRRRLEQAVEAMVAEVVPERTRPARITLVQRNVAWDDPTLTLEECIASYKAMLPMGDLPDWKIAIRFRRGDRLYPPTKSWRRTGIRCQQSGISSKKRR
jgi:hypothetical protein